MNNSEMVPVKCPRCRRSFDVDRRELGEHSGMMKCPLCSSDFRIHGHELAEKFDKQVADEAKKRGDRAE